MNSDEHAIRDLVQRWMAASRDGDTAAVLELMTDDVVFMVAGKAPFGKEAFARSGAEMKGTRFEGKSDILEIQIAGEWAWMRTRLEVNVAFPDGAKKELAGFTLSVLRKERDGRWRIARDANLLSPG
jgi:uncharacterized protein (TIGR02246 family)